MAISYKDLLHTGEEIDASIDLIDSHAANETIHVSLLDREAWNGKQDALTIGTNMDESPTENSTKPVSSGGVYSALSGKQDALVAGTNMDSSPTSGHGTVPVTSGGVYSALTEKVGMVDVFAGIPLTASSSSHIDLDTITDFGTYSNNSKSNGNYLDHSPTVYPYIMFVTGFGPTSNNRIQRIYAYENQTGAWFKMFIRFKSSAGWGHWFEFSGVDTGS